MLLPTPFLSILTSSVFYFINVFIYFWHLFLSTLFRWPSFLLTLVVSTIITFDLIVYHSSLFFFILLYNFTKHRPSFFHFASTLFVSTSFRSLFRPFFFLILYISALRSTQFVHFYNPNLWFGIRNGIAGICKVIPKTKKIDEREKYFSDFFLFEILTFEVGAFLTDKLNILVSILYVKLKIP